MTKDAPAAYPDAVPATVVLQQDPVKMVLEADAERAAFQKRVQDFFASLEAETKKPHFGGHARDFYKAILIRAEASGIFKPHTEAA